jgi:hypothetical protein
MRRAAAVFLVLAVTGCAESRSSALWPGPDWRAPSQAAATRDADTATEPATATDDSPTRVPRTRTRRGSGTPPDLLFPNPQDQPRPQVVEPVAPPRVPLNEPTNNVLAPRDPKSPYSADGFGYQRQGTTILGPNGTSNIVGSSIFGPRGTTCHAVGNSLFCN